MGFNLKSQNDINESKENIKNGENNKKYENL